MLVPVSVFLDPKTIENLKFLSKVKGISKAKLMRSYVEEFVAIEMAKLKN